MDKLFGELRALLAQPLDDSLMLELTALLERARALDVQRYEEQWKAYLSSFVRPMTTIVSRDDWITHMSLYPPSARIILAPPWTFDAGNDNDSLEAMLANMPLASLIGLNLRRWKIDPLGLNLLISHRDLRLERVDLSQTDISRLGFERLVNAPTFKHITHLALDGIGLVSSDVRTLTYAAGFKGIESLSLSHNLLNQQGAKTLSKCPHLNQLHTLKLARTNLGNTGFGMLSRSSFLADLKTLNVANNRLSYDAIVDLGRASFTHQLQSLDLSNNRLDDDAIERLFEIQFESLIGLNLGDNYMLTSAVVHMMFSSSWFERIETLTLNNLGVGGVFVEHLSKHNKPLKLKRLSLEGVNIRDDHAKMLATCTCLPHLRHLSLNQNQIKYRAAHALRKSTSLPVGLQIDLQNNPSAWCKRPAVQVVVGT